MGSNTHSTTDSNFEKDVLKSDVPVLVDFWAEWCVPCKRMAPKLDEIANEYPGKIKVMKVNIDENPQSPTKYGVRGIPTLILFKDGKEVGQSVGDVSKDKIVAFVSPHLG